MKLSKEVLLEIVSLVQEGILKDRDISENMRQLDLVASGDEDVELVLSKAYLVDHPRASVWIEPKS